MIHNDNKHHQIMIYIMYFSLTWKAVSVDCMWVPTTLNTTPVVGDRTRTRRAPLFTKRSPFMWLEKTSPSVERIGNLLWRNGNGRCRKEITSILNNTHRTTQKSHISTSAAKQSPSAFIIFIYLKILTPPLRRICLHPVMELNPLWWQSFPNRGVWYGYSSDNSDSFFDARLDITSVKTNTSGTPYWTVSGKKGDEIGDTLALGFCDIRLKTNSSGRNNNNSNRRPWPYPWFCRLFSGRRWAFQFGRLRFWDGTPLERHNEDGWRCKPWSSHFDDAASTLLFHHWPRRVVAVAVSPQPWHASPKERRMWL